MVHPEGAQFEKIFENFFNDPLYCSFVLKANPDRFSKPLRLVKNIGENFTFLQQI